MFNKRLRAISSALILVLAVVGAALFATDAASANEDACVPSEAWTETIEHPAVTHEEQVFDYWQRYSWTGGPHDPDTPPAFPGPDWQPNVQGDPHGIGVEGAYYRSNGNSGKGDWFYLEAVEKTVVIVDEEAWTEIIEHPAVVCPEPPTEEPTDEPTTPTEEPTTGTPTAEPTTGVETPEVELPEPTTICGVTIQQPKPGEPIMRDILCPLPGEDEPEVDDKKDPVIKTETRSEPTRTVKIYTHESGKTTEVVRDYGPADELVEEGL